MHSEIVFSDLIFLSLFALYDKNTIVILYRNKNYIVENNRLYDIMFNKNKLIWCCFSVRTNLVEGIVQLTQFLFKNIN